MLKCRKGLSLCSRSSREGSSFLFHEEKKRSKENSPAALFCLLQHFSTLNKKNSLRSNSFLFLTLRKAPPLHGKKVRPDLYVLSATLLRSLLVGVCFHTTCFFASFISILSSRAKRRISRTYNVVLLLRMLMLVFWFCLCTLFCLAFSYCHLERNEM